MLKKTTVRYAIFNPIDGSWEYHSKVIKVDFPYTIDGHFLDIDKLLQNIYDHLTFAMKIKKPRIINFSVL